MAGFAIFLGVGAIQKKPCGIVIEGRAARSRSLRWRQTGNDHGQHKKDHRGQLPYQTINDHFLISHRALHGALLRRQGMTCELHLQILSDSMTNIRKAPLTLCNLGWRILFFDADLGS
jgi:hypothetical protein